MARPPIRDREPGQTLNPIDVAMAGADIVAGKVSSCEGSDRTDVPSSQIEGEVRDAESDSPVVTLPQFAAGPDTVVEVLVIVDQQGVPYAILVGGRGCDDAAIVLHPP